MEGPTRRSGWGIRSESFSHFARPLSIEMWSEVNGGGHIDSIKGVTGGDRITQISSCGSVSGRADQSRNSRRRQKGEYCDTVATSVAGNGADAKGKTKVSR